MGAIRFLGKFNGATMKHELLPSGVIEAINDVAFVRRSNTYRIWECVVKKEIGQDGVSKVKFDLGWEALVEGNNIQEGDSLYFDLHGNGVFSMHVFDANNVSKQLDYLIGDINKGKWKIVGGLHVLIMPGENSFAATTYLTKSPYESFMVNIDSKVVVDGYLTIPITYAKKNLIYEKSEDVVPVVLEVQGSCTTVLLKFIKKGGDLKACYLNSTIRDFVTRTGAADNGVLVFELQSPLDPVVFKVTIFNL